MISISQIVTDVFTLAIRQAYPELEDIPILITNGKFADYQCNSAMSICQVSEILLLNKIVNYLVFLLQLFSFCCGSCKQL